MENTISRETAIAAIVAAVISGIVSFAVAVVNTLHLQRQTRLEIHIRTATLFSELVGIAYGYGIYTEPQKEVLDRIVNDFKKPLSDTQSLTEFRNLINLSINMPVPLARQVAAAEEIATLAIKYPRLLRESALSSLVLIKELIPKTATAYDRLVEHRPWWRRFGV